ncbi:MAG: hypothetical protein RLZZ618_1812 [Pseudomonadota bacterium]|jgi:chain length determinant protein EpsF
MTFPQFLSILRARWRVALATFLFIVTAAVIVSLVLPKKYTATAAVLVDVKSPDPIAGVQLAGMMSPGYMATQVDIIQSDRVAQQVVRTLKLVESPQLRANWQAQTEGRGSLEAWIAEMLQASLSVKPSRESSVINIAYKSPDPKFSALLANAFVQAYIDTSLELRTGSAKANNTFFDGRLVQLRQDLEAAQTRLSNFQRAEGITGNDERVDVETARLSELSSQLVALQAVSAETASRQAQVKSSGDQMSDVLNNGLVSGLKADLSRQQARLEEVSSRLGDAHPQVQELKASIAETRARVDAEIKRVGNSVGINATINRSREGEVRAALDAQRARVLKLKSQRDELSVKQRDVEHAQRAYDAVASRVTQTSLESQSKLTNLEVLNPAVEPPNASSPNLLLNTALAVFLGGVLGVIVTLVREMLDRRVRIAQDVVYALDMPVIGSLPRPARRRFFGGHDRALPRRMLVSLSGSPSRA